MTSIYYFSGTGNSLYVAKKLNNSIKESSLKSIVVSTKQKVVSDESDTVIFVFPLYYLSFPKIVLDFISSFVFLEDTKIVFVVTRGFPPMGGVFHHCNNLLRKKKNKLHQGFYVNMPSNDVILFGLQNIEEQKRILSSVDTKIETIVTSIQNDVRIIEKEPFWLIRYLRYKPAYLKQIKDNQNNFYVTEKCTSCKICSIVCPLDNIVIKEGKPVWGMKCQLCEGCINICPQKAIEYGSKSSRQQRYINPNIKYTEIASQKMV